MIAEGGRSLRVLLVSPFLPHAAACHAGGKLVHFLHEQLMARHDVVLVTRRYPEEEGALESLRAEGHRIHALPAAGPWFRGGIVTLAQTVGSYRALVRLAERVAAAEGPFDVCQVECTETGYFWRPRRMPPAVLTCQDLVAKRVSRSGGTSRGTAAWAARLASKAQVLAERRTLRKFAAIFLLSQIEVDWCRRLHPQVRPGVLRYPGGLEFVGLPRREVPGRVLFVGALGRPQNVESLHFLLREVWPAVRIQVPTAELMVVGAGASPELAAEIAAAPGARASGAVESVEPAYREAAVFAAPILTGGGIIVKILDALAAGVPVVTTPYGNEGIEGAPGRDILVAAEAADFARAVVRALVDGELRRAVGSAGQRHVETHFPPAGVVATLESAYEKVVARARNRSA